MVALHWLLLWVLKVQMSSLTQRGTLAYIFWLKTCR